MGARKPVEKAFAGCHPGQMLLKLTGSSGAGKTTLAFALALPLELVGATPWVVLLVPTLPPRPLPPP